MRTLLALLACVSMATPTVLAQAPTARAQDTYLHCGRLLDAVSPSVKTEQTVLVRDGRIASVTAGYTEAPAGAEVIDLKDHLVAP